MARKRDPKRDQAFDLWKNSGGAKKLTEIAKELEVSPGTVRGWKNKDDWDGLLNGTFQKNERNVPKNNTERSEKKKRGAPPGNTNAIGNKGGKGGPLGNKHSLGHGAPARNENALKTGEYKTFWREALEPDEISLLEQQQHIDIVGEIKEEILQYSLREMFIIQRIKQLKSDEPPMKKRELKQRKKVDVPIQVEDPLSGEYKTIYKKDYDLVTVEVEEEVSDPIELILSHEEALTRVQDKKVKALDTLHKITDEYQHKKAMDEIKITIAKEKWELEKRGHQDQSNESEQWASTLEDVFVKRKKKREQAKTATVEVKSGE